MSKQPLANASKQDIWQNFSLQAKLWETSINKIKAIRIQVMQIKTRQCQTGNYYDTHTKNISFYPNK